MRERVLLFGGTFDPVHCGHLILAERAREELRAERVIFIPCSLPPHKVGYTPTPAEHRLKLLRMAVGGHPSFEVSAHELRRGGVSYTHETIRHFRMNFPGTVFHFLVGLDSLLDFTTWREWRSILRMTKLVVGERIVHKERRIPREIDRSRVVFLDFPHVEISGSDIRRRVKMGKSIRYLVPEPVRVYIIRHRLYQ